MDKEKILLANWIMCPDGTMIPSFHTHDFRTHQNYEDEELLDQYLESGEIEDEQIRKMITERKIFPCFFGSALKLQGVEEFLLDYWKKSQDCHAPFSL